MAFANEMGYSFEHYGCAIKIKFELKKYLKVFFC